MDSLENLPVDENVQTSPAEMKALNRYFGNKKTNKKVWSEVKEVVIATVLFLVLSTPYFDTLLDYLPHTESPMVKLGLKGLIYATLLYVSFIMLG